MTARKYNGIIKKSHATLVAISAFFAQDMMKQHNDANVHNQGLIGYQYLWRLGAFALVRIFKCQKRLGWLELSKINNWSKMLKLQSLYRSNLTSKRQLLSSCR